MKEIKVFSVDDFLLRSKEILHKKIPKVLINLNLDNKEYLFEYKLYKPKEDKNVKI